MKHMKLWIAVCLLGLTVACSKGMKERLFGTDDTPSATDTGTTTSNASSVDDQLMSKVAADLQSEIIGHGEVSLNAPSAAACTPGAITISSTTTTYPPQVYRSSTVYTVNGVTYFSGNYYDSSGGRLVFVTQKNGTCVTNISTYGTLSSQGSSFIQWPGPDGKQKYQYYYYTYTYKYQGDILRIDGQYTMGTETGTTVYPIHYTINI